jgi:hypothetical protein
VSVADQPLADRLSLLYQGLQAAVFSNRSLATDHSRFPNIALPASVGDSAHEPSGPTIVGNFTFPCVDLSDRSPNLIFKGAAWPQVFYIHPRLAPWLRDTFGFHAAHFLGNYLFGDSDPPECRLSSGISAVEAFNFSVEGVAPPSEFGRLIGRCGVRAEESAIVVEGGETVEGFHSAANVTGERETVCALRSLTSAARIVHTFGSRLGFWATALQGRAGAVVNVAERICLNLTNSQQGSLWHTFCPNAMRSLVFISNKVLFPCETSLENFALYFRYLLW